VKVSFFHEPELEFGKGGTHVDIRHGILRHGPLDLGDAAAPSRLRVGLIGTEETVSGVREWLELGFLPSRVNLRIFIPRSPVFQIVHRFVPPWFFTTGGVPQFGSVSSKLPSRAALVTKPSEKQRRYSLITLNLCSNKAVRWC
jgi:hypothetical protein